MSRFSKLILAAALCLWAQIGDIAVAAESNQRVQHDKVAFRLNEAGRQRMLTQRMSKAACLANAGVDAALHRDMARDAAQRFGMVLTGLQSGNSDFGLEAETSRMVQIQLEKTDALWAEFAPLVERLSGEASDQDALIALRKSNVRLLKQMNRSVTAIQSETASGLDMSQQAMALNVAGRQRMLTQKAIKELCMIMTGIDPEADRKALRATVTEFEDTMHDLRVGSPERNLVPAPTWQIDAQLEMVEGLWFELVPVMHTVMAGGDISHGDLGYAAFIAEAVLGEMNNAVLMYEKL